ILDETDSGLDIDALRTVAQGVNSLRSPERAIVVITHYQRLLNYIVPDKVHVLLDGRVVRSGGRELALELEESGYRAFGHVAVPDKVPALRYGRVARTGRRELALGLEASGNGAFGHVAAQAVA